MGWSVCTVSGCPELHPGKGKCPTHQAQAWATQDAQRGGTTQRGYGWAHQRDGSAAIAGATHCAACGQAFTEDNPVTRGHVKAVRDGGSSSDGYAAQCRACNLGWRKTGL